MLLGVLELLDVLGHVVLIAVHPRREDDGAAGLLFPVDALVLDLDDRGHVQALGEGLADGDVLGVLASGVDLDAGDSGGVAAADLGVFHVEEVGEDLAEPVVTSVASISPFLKALMMA